MIPVRRLAMDYSASFCVDGANPTAPVNPGQLWLIPDDPIFSHFLAMLSALFPHGEEFFVTTVRDNRAGIGDDGVLRRQINAFIGQEGMHGREHRTLTAQRRRPQLGLTHSVGQSAPSARPQHPQRDSNPCYLRERQAS